MDRGFVRVRPLAGGLDAWVASGFQVEEIEEAWGGPERVA